MMQNKVNRVFVSAFNIEDIQRNFITHIDLVLYSAILYCSIVIILCFSKI